MIPQSTFMIVAKIRDEQLENMLGLLATMNKNIGQADPENNLVPFGQFDHLHVARFVILDATTSEEIKEHGISPRPWHPSLAFLGDCDGDANLFLAQLAARAGPGLKKIFSFCESFSDKIRTFWDG